MHRRYDFVSSFLEDEDAACAGCGATWSMELLVDAHAARRLRSMGFAVIDMGDAICINCCPHCELNYFQRETLSWPSQSLLSSP